MNEVINQEILNEKRQDSIKRLISLRDEWSDEIPEELVHGNFKVRTNWFNLLVNEIETAMYYCPVSDEFKEDYQRFYAHITNDEFKDRRTNAADIAMANDMLEKTIRELSSKE